MNVNLVLTEKLNKRLHRHSSRASSKRVLSHKIFIGSIGKMVQSRPKF